jgi:hypothetical protein
LPASVTGPIALNASMTGHANLRSAEAPAFERAVDGTVQIVDAGFSVDRRNIDAVMMRRWRYVIFPARSGRLTIPPLTTTILTPAGERRLLRCAAQTLMATADAPAAAAGIATKPAASPRVEHVWPWIGGLLLVTISTIAVPPLRRARALRANVRAIVRPTPAETREALHAWLGARGLDAGALLAEASDRGDAIRGIISFLDAAERDRIPFDLAEARRRAADVVETWAVAARMAQSR